MKISKIKVREWTTGASSGIVTVDVFVEEHSVHMQDGFIIAKGAGQAQASYMIPIVNVLGIVTQESDNWENDNGFPTEREIEDDG